MRTIALAILLALAACDKQDKQNALIESVVGDGAPPTYDAATPPPKASAAASASASVPMPERPVPKPQTLVSQTAPEEVQMKAIAYMVAMRAPHPDDAPADDAFAKDLVEKLKPVALGMDRGPDKAKWNRVERIASGRQIDIYLSEGCDEKAPFNAVVQRANVPLSTLLSHGVLVVRCHDQKRQCLQSTRDPTDVLCTTAPRHK